MTSYHSITSIMKWANAQDVQYVGGDRELPYVYKDGMFHYFGQQESGYALLMTCLSDLAEMEDA